MILSFDSNNVDAIQVDFTDEELMDMNKVIRQFPLALATLTLKYMQDICPPEKEYYLHLKSIVSDLFNNYLDDYLKEC